MLQKDETKLCKRQFEVARRFQEAVRDVVYKADNEDLLFPSVLYSQKLFIRRVSGEGLMARKGFVRDDSARR